jgi:hypothetical protein
LHALRELDLSGTRITDAGLAHLRPLEELATLRLADTPVGAGGLAPLQDLKKLEDLDLAGTRVADGGLPHLAGLPKLKVLKLGRTKVTDAGLVHLQGLPALAELDLRDAKGVTDAGLRHLKGVKGLRTLHVMSLTSETEDELKKALPGLRITNLFRTFTIRLPSPRQTPRPADAGFVEWLKGQPVYAGGPLIQPGEVANLKVLGVSDNPDKTYSARVSFDWVPGPGRGLKSLAVRGTILYKDSDKKGFLAFVRFTTP